MRNVLLISLALAACLLAWPAPADDHHGQKRKRHGWRGQAAPPSPLYQERCGACHLAYPPGLLPAGSWRKILAAGDDHYGEDLGLPPAERGELDRYLAANAADASRANLARKIMRSLGPGTPLRITEVPYIIHKHQDHELPPGVFQRKSVGSFANCGACHPGAAAGCFDDDAVRIPAQ